MSSNEFLLKVDSFETELQCINCKQYYTYKEVGTLKCFYHPGVYGSNIGKREDSLTKKYTLPHYSCCKSTKEMADKTHYEKKYPRGCIPIDHVASETEFKRLMLHPYTLVPASYKDQLEIVKRREIFQRHDPFILVSSFTQFDQIEAIKIPNRHTKWKRETADIIKIDLNADYDEMLRTYGLSDASATVITDKEVQELNPAIVKEKFYELSNNYSKNTGSYYDIGEFGLNMETENIGGENSDDEAYEAKESDIIPFYLIKRVGCNMNQEKLRTIGTYRSCLYY